MHVAIGQYQVNIETLVSKKKKISLTKKRKFPMHTTAVRGHLGDSYRPVVRYEATISVIVSRLLQADDNNRINKRIAPILTPPVSDLPSINSVGCVRKASDIDAIRLALASLAQSSTTH